MARWTLYLSKFNIKLVYIPGKKNIQAEADTLLRRPDLFPEGTNNKNIVMLPEHLFANLINTELQRRIANTKNVDYDAAKVIKGLLGQGPNEAKKDLEDWKVEEFKGKSVLFCKEKNYILNDGELRQDII